MSPSKARSLRERMSIDPDAPEPVTRSRRPRAATADQAPPAAPPPDPPAAEPHLDVAPEPAVVEPEPPEPAGPEPAEPEVAAPEVVEAPEPEPPTASREPARAPTRRSSSKRVGGRRRRDDPGWATALDDPAVSGGGNGYRSFYVSDEVFARFRAAIYWTARRPDVSDVPDNMSAGVEDYMDQVATDLERRFNARDVFPPTPDQVRSHRRRENLG